LRELGVIADGSVLVVDGLIREIGPTRRVENLALARDAQEIDAAGCVVMPGFVDCHTHLLFPQFPTASSSERAQSGDAGRGLHNTTAKRIAFRARSYVEAMARHGATTIEAKTGSGVDETSETKLLRAMAALDGDSIDVMPSLVARLDGLDVTESQIAERVDWYCEQWLPRIRQRRLARWLELYWDAGAAPREHAERLLQRARQLGFALRIHNESTRCREPLELGLDCGAASVDHLEHAGAGEIGLLGRAECLAVLQPPHGFHAAVDRYAPGRALIDAGAAVALATDFNPWLSPTLSMAASISLACSRLHFTPAEAICAATANAACVLGCSARVGSLECGKQADLIMLEVADYRELARHFGHNLVSMTMKRGTVIYQQGEVLRRSNLRPVA